AARAVACAEREEEALADEATAPGLAQRQRRIPGVVGLPADAADVDHHGIIPAGERVERAEAQAEAAVVHLRHAVDDRGDPLFERGRDDLAAVAMARADAAAADQGEPRDLALLRDAIERRAVMTEMARVVAEIERRTRTQPPIARDQVAQRRDAVADHMRAGAQRQRQDAAALPRP